MTSARSIAIVGVACRFPDAPSLSALWSNVLAGKSAARAVRAGDWPVPPGDVIDPHGAVDHAHTSSLCRLVDAEDDLTDIDLPEDLRLRLSRLARVTLRVGNEAWKSVRGHTARGRTGVILANIALPTDGASRLADHLLLGGADRESRFEPLDAFPSALPAGLLCRALGLRGGSFTLDAACASSLYAIHLACADLEAGRVDAVLAGGVSLAQSLYTQIGFTQLKALSRSGRCAPYDASADGLVVGEGAGFVVLKREEDAHNDGDRVMAVVRGIGLSNDIGGSLLSPEREGQLRAMRAAYAEAGWSPADVDLIEGHGTGTPRGDAVELESLSELWRGVTGRTCVLGSVKSNVGHLLTAAGIAGVCKVLAAFEARALPPTAHFSAGAPGLVSAPLRVLSAAEPWPQRDDASPRRAAVSGFGFGGINAHLLLEEASAAAPRRVSHPSRVSVAPRAPVAIAVVGMAVHVGRLDSLGAFARAVLLGESVRDELPEGRWPRLATPNGHRSRLAHVRGAFLRSFDVELPRFKVPPADADSILPQQLLMLQVAADALDDAGGLKHTTLTRVGAVIGIGLDLESTSFHLRWLARQRVRRWAREGNLTLDDDTLDAWAARVADALAPPLDATRTLGALGGIVPSRIAREFRLGGPSFAVAGDEASGLRAVEVAARMLQRGDVDAMVAGAIDLAGDLRSVVAGDALSPFSASGKARPFDSRADGRNVAEGAGAVVLKRLDDALAAGDRIYAVVRGLGAASGDALEVGAARQAAYVEAGRAAYAEANVAASAISLVEAHGSGSRDEDTDEARALAELFSSEQPGSTRTALASTAGVVGQAGSAAGMLSFIKAGLCLFHEVIPPLGDVEVPTSAVAWESTPFYLPRLAEVWLRNRADGPRHAAVASMGRDGTCMHVVLAGHDAPAPRVSAPRETRLTRRSAAIFLLRDDVDGVAATSRLRALAQTASSLERLAAQWHLEPAIGSVARSIVATSIPDLLAQLSRPALATSAKGALAFVFPGSGNHYVGMGRSLALALPDVYRSLDDEVSSLEGHLSPRWVSPRRSSWPASWEDLASRALLDSPERALVAQVAHGVAVSDALVSLGLRPTAYLGYSLGESAALFASRAWQGRDEMFARTLASPLFRTELAGPRTVVCDAWGDGAGWRVVVVTRGASSVRGALVGRAALLIVNTPGECVVGGPVRDVDSTIAALGCDALTIEGVPTVHLPVAGAVKDSYRALHSLPTTPPAGVQFYSSAWGRPYEPTTDSAAESLLESAISGFDFPAVVERAWADGVRVFVEAGPQASVTRMIGRILEGRPHVAVSACHRGQDGFRSLLVAVGRAAEAGCDVDLAPLYGALPPAAVAHQPGSVRTIWLARERPPWPDAPAAPPVAQPPSSLLAAFFASAAATASAHETFLRVARESLALQAALLHPDGETHTHALSPLFDRATCLEFAVGSIARVLGPSFADVDQHPTRVRLPDEPLMLVDRILSVDGVMGEIGPGRVVTEHDVLPDAFYLDGGRAPVCISVEAGQADLFLCAYLGIDRETRGERVYRLLDAKIRFHRDLPRPGETIRYDIRIDRFIRQGDTWLFFFRFDGTIGGAPFITMFDGCAGFFSTEQLESGRGIVLRADTASSSEAPRTARGSPFAQLVPVAPSALGEGQLDALRRGDLEHAFGESFRGKMLTPAMRLPSGRMKLVDRILTLDARGGAAGLGRVVGEADVSPDAWYLTCHFVDDQVMPGTLMYECCLHTLRVLLLRLGWVFTDGARDVHYAPVAGVASELRCRGQVTKSTRRVRYEVEVLEIGYDPEPYVLASAAMYADDKHVVQMDGMSVKIAGLTRSDIEREWGVATAAAPAFSRLQVVAYAEGNPSECFGARYAPFDNERRLARLPRDPFLFLDRVVSVDAPPWVLEPSGWATCEVDVQPDAWYFVANRQGTMPFVVLLEAALQPCGWLAAYAGSALLSDHDLHFRNLDGTGTQLEEVTPDAGTLTTRVRLTKTSQAGGMILQEFDLEVLAAGKRVYEGTTGFGFFPSAALAAQVGVRGAAAWPVRSPGRPFDLPKLAPVVPTPAAPPKLASGFALPSAALAMIDTVSTLDLHGGARGLGLIIGEKHVDAGEWFFRAHFYQDPVMPGSLGLEALLQLLKVFAGERFPGLRDTHRFQAMALGVRHVWQYRGQVVPESRVIRVEADVTSIREGDEPVIVAKGQLSVDGKIIYSMSDFAVRLAAAGPS